MITWARFSALFGLGFLGVIALLLTTLVLDPTYADQAEELGIPLRTLVLLTGAQSAILLAASVVAGLHFAPRVDLGSHVLSRVSGGRPVLESIRPELRPALGGGAIVGAMLVAVLQV